MFYYFNAEMKYWEKPVPAWATATDAELAEILQDHYDGLIDLHAKEGWEIGSERIVHLNAMEAMEDTGLKDSHVEQDVVMVLLNKGGKLLSDGVTECAFVVGQKNVLANDTSREYGYMNSTATNSGGWDKCPRRTWCNNVYKNALPSTLVGIFKEHQNVTADGLGSTTVTSNDYFALPAEKEIFGSNTFADSTAESSLIQLEYYKTSSNRIKKAGESGSAVMWGERSPSFEYSTNFCAVTARGVAESYQAYSAFSFAPQGCI